MLRISGIEGSQLSEADELSFVGLSRRKMLTFFGSTALLVGAYAAEARAGAFQTVFNAAEAPFLADQTGQSDASSAIQAAVNAVIRNGRGCVYLPSGDYRCLKPIVCSSSSITIKGDGQASTILLIEHSGTGISIKCNSNSQAVEIADIGLSPISGSEQPAGTALSIDFPTQDSGWQHCAIENVDVGVARPGYTAFSVGLAFNNLWRGSIRNVNYHSNIGLAPNSKFVVLYGKTVDSRFDSCNADGCEVGFNVMDYGEGIHIINCVVICRYGFWSGAKPYSGDGHTSPLINVLGLYISGSEFNCSGTALFLGYVDQGWISDSHFGTTGPGFVTISVCGSSVQISNCEITGCLGIGSPTKSIGIQIGNAADGWGSDGTTVADCVFTNLLVGVAFEPGSWNSTATNMRMFGISNAHLISVPVPYGSSFFIRPMIDDSGNNTNSAQWMSTTSISGPAGVSRSLLSR